MNKKVLVISIVVALLIALLVVTFLTGGSKRLYDYDSYAEFIQLGETDGIKIYDSIEYEILKSFWNLYDVKKEGIAVTTYRSEADDVYVKMYDTVNIDYVGKKDGVAFVGGTATGYDLVIGSNTFIDGFEDGLIGYKIGDTVSLNITFPEDYGSSELNGAKTVFEVKVNSIIRTEYPEFNDENVKAKTEYNTVSEFKEATRESVIDNLLWSKLISSSQILSYPEAEKKRYYKQYSTSVETDILMFGINRLPNHIRYIGINGEEPTADNSIVMEEKAVFQISCELIVLRFMELKPELKIEGAEYRAELEKLYNKQVEEQGFTGSFTDFIKKYDEKALEITIYHDVLMKYLREHCVIVDDITKNV